MYCFLLSFLCSFLWLHCIHCLFLLNPLSTSTFVTCDIEYQSFSELTASTWPAVTRCDDDVLWAPYSGPTYCRLRLANTGISRSSSARLATPRDVTSTQTPAEHVSTASPTLAACTTATVPRHQSAERPTLHQISSLMYLKIQRRQVIMSVLHPGCAQPPRWSSPVLWRRFEKNESIFLDVSPNDGVWRACTIWHPSRMGFSSL